jgi:hypothetical protein
MTKRLINRWIKPERTTRRVVSLVVVLALAIAVASAARLLAISSQDLGQQAASGISAEALAQIEALIAEKEARTPTERKIDSQLIYELKKQAGLPIARGVADIETDVPYALDGHAVLDVKANVTADLRARLAAMGGEVVDGSLDNTSMRIHLNLDQVEALAALPDVAFVQPQQDAMTSRMSGVSTRPSMSREEWTRTRVLRRQLSRERLAAFVSGGLEPQLPNIVGGTGVGSRSSEGDVAHRAFDARGTFHVDGTGIKIGVLSDGVTNLAASQALGDLGPVTVLPGQTGSGDEGTAMLEIIHDLAPGAQLYFATAFSGITSFAQNIRDLRTAGCDIIVDDVFYFVETPFQDGAPGPTNTNGGAVVQAVKDVTAGGALYFSSAGNSGNLNDGTSGVWEGDFSDGGVVSLPVPGTGRVHSFGAATFNTLTANSRINLYWSDPLGGSTNDYDLFVLNTAGTAVAASSTNIQNGTQDPYEDAGNRTTGQRVVVRKASAAAGRFLHLNANRGRLTFVTAGQTHGHSTVNSVGAYGVAATPAGTPLGAPPNPVGPFPNAFNSANTVELFSSDGPRRIFYNANGTAITPGDVSSTGGQVLAKPDITAADGVSDTGVGGFPTTFFGTSAAAPHAGAIAALLMQAVPGMTQAQVRSTLASSAIDIEAPGNDRDSGVGIIMAQGALAAAGAVGTAFVTLDSVNATENPGDGNGVINRGEGAKLVIALKNFGIANATAISASLSSTTPGISVTVPSASAYSDLAVGAAGANARPLLFTVASTFDCPGVIDFNLNVVYTGGLTSPVNFPFKVTTGAKAFTVGSALDAIAPSSTADYAGVTGVQVGRINRLNGPSNCSTPKAFPGLAATTGNRQFDALTFPTCGTVPSCVQVSFTNSTTGGNPSMFAVGYIPAFVSSNLATNYAGDAGVSNLAAGATPFSFAAPAGPTSVAVAMHEVNPGLGIGSNYSMTISGACFGACTTPNQVPVAKAKNVTVSADANCQANASIDNGSFDPDGDALTITQSPAGPYPLGTTTVLLTVTDPKGATSQATGTVTVVDTTAPAVTGFGVVAPTMWPPNHRMVDVTVNYGASDNCSAVTCVLSVASNEPINGLGDGDTAPDWVIVDSHHLQLRAERSGAGTGRTYTITLTCTDAAGNPTVRTATVLVPHSKGK